MGRLVFIQSVDKEVWLINVEFWYSQYERQLSYSTCEPEFLFLLNKTETLKALIRAIEDKLLKIILEYFRGQIPGVNIKLKDDVTKVTKIL